LQEQAHLLPRLDREPRIGGADPGRGLRGVGRSRNEVLRGLEVIGDQVRVLVELVVMEALDRPGDRRMQRDAARAQLHGVGDFLNERMAKRKALWPFVIGQTLHELEVRQSAKRTLHVRCGRVRDFLQH